MSSRRPSAAASQALSRMRGFTLLELLVALLVLAIGLPLALAGVSHALGTISLAERRAEAGRLAEGLTNQLVATDQWQSSAQEGVFEPDEWGEGVQRYRWQVALDDWRDPLVRQLTVTVGWEQQGRPQEVRLTTLVGDRAAAAEQEAAP